jgi:hypothetical protein
MLTQNPTNPAEKNRSKQIMAAAGILSLILLALYTWLYHFEPLTKPVSAQWNALVVDILTVIPALAAAILGILVTHHFKRGEPPFLIWLIFTLGWWAWVAGEVGGLVHDIVWYTVPYPDLTILDLFWTMGYLCFILALFFQFRLIYGRERKIGIVYYILIVAATLLVNLGLTQWALKAGLGKDISWFALYLAIFYPVCDVVAGIAALWLSFLFGRGMWGRPWWGLIAFAVAASINIYLWIGGSNLLSDRAYTTWDLISSIAYVGGYLVVAIAFLSNHLFIEHGPVISRKRDAAAAPLTPPQGAQ